MKNTAHCGHYGCGVSRRRSHSPPSSTERSRPLIRSRIEEFSRRGGPSKSSLPSSFEPSVAGYYFSVLQSAGIAKRLGVPLDKHASGFDRNQLYSDEGPPIGDAEGFWPETVPALAAWLLRWN